MIIIIPRNASLEKSRSFRGHAGSYGKITRDDGKPQAMFRGYPLYYFAGDAKAGDTNGHALRDIWYVIDPGNFPLK
ncbi:MAG: COG4315 family predicted lipoprotein [Desulfuromonadales bacterium]